MQIRYMGFEQRQNSRVYRFDIREQGQPAIQATVTADMTIFQTHRVGIQEGPSLCGSKLTSDLENGRHGEHELTGEDVRVFANNKAMAEAQRAEMRKNPRKRPPAPKGTESSPWRNFGI